MSQDPPSPTLPQGDGGLPAQLYQKLRIMARRLMQGEAIDHTLQTTALVHEAWIRLLRSDPTLRDEPARVLAAASEAMRRALIDHARGRDRIKRGGSRRRVLIELTDLPTFAAAAPQHIVALDDAFHALEIEDPEAADVVRMRFLLGMSVEDTAKALDISQRTVKRRWAFARTWLFRELSARIPGSDTPVAP